MTKVRYPVKYANKEQYEKLGLNQFPNAGPYPNITGMRNWYWGHDALLIRHGAYVYKVDKETYDKA